MGVSNIIECQWIDFKLLETPTAHKIEADLSCYVKIMAVQFVLALHRSLKKGKQLSRFSVAREQTSVKIIFSSSGKNLKPRNKKIVVLLLWHEGLSPDKKSGDLIFRSGTDRSKIRETPS